MSQALVHNNTIYLSGLVGVADEPVAAQTQAIFDQVDKLLAAAGSSKAHLLSATIWLADMADFAAMNAVWDAWVADVDAPTRATGESRLAAPGYKVEIIITAAKP
jgi:enamine deaminase RidA (YjgF/YER057c/UK114 family)